MVPSRLLSASGFRASGRAGSSAHPVLELHDDGFLLEVLRVVRELETNPDRAEPDAAGAPRWRASRVDLHVEVSSLDLERRAHALHDRPRVVDALGLSPDVEPDEHPRGAFLLHLE